MILIAGLGSIGRRHLRILQELGETEILLFRTGLSTLPDEGLAGIPVVFNLNEALAHNPEAVIVSNPTALHLDVAIPAAQQGCHILLEKPISDSLNRIADLREALNVGGGGLLVGYHYRFHPGLQLVRSFIENEEIGKPIYARVQWGEYLPDWHPWEDYRRGYSARADLGGGVVLTLSHPFDYLRWLMGEIVEVVATTDRLGDLGIDVEDSAEVILRFECGALGSLHLNYNQRPPRHDFEIVGSQGSIRWDYYGKVTRIYRLDRGDWETLPLPESFERDDLYRAQMRHFLRVCRQQESPQCTLEDGVRALELALAVYKSQQIGAWIRL